MSKPTRTAWMTAIEAARLLGVERGTLYAYVSRKRVRSRATAGLSRARVYSRDDVERLLQQTEARRNPEVAAARVLQWGLPVLETSISLIDGGHLYYRGFDATEFAQRRSIRELASLMWTGQPDFPFADDTLPSMQPVDESLPFMARAQVLLALEAARMPPSLQASAPDLAQIGWRSLHLVACAAAPQLDTESPLDGALAQAWNARGPDAAALLRAALILCADHELNVSAFTARCVASAGANLHAVVLAGLAALSGARHGGASLGAEGLLASMRNERNIKRALAARVECGERLDGFGQPLYPQGDPRARALLRWLGKRHARSAEWATVRKVAGATVDLIGRQPNVDFALAATATVLRLPPGSSLAIFAIGRTIGWIAHAIEQYANGQIIRPRGKYTGPAPGELAPQPARARTSPEPLRRRAASWLDAARINR